LNCNPKLGWAIELQKKGGNSIVNALLSVE